MFRELVKVDKNGTKHFVITCRCPKCNGTGEYHWGYLYPQSGICFQCDGTGINTYTEKEYTPEYEAKLQARREKREAKRRAEEEAKRRAEEEAKAKREAKWQEQRAKSNYVGNEGDKIETVVTIDFIAEFETEGYYGRPLCKTVYGFRDENDNRIVWITTTCLCIAHENESGYYDTEHVSKGDVVKVKGSIKGHKEYKGEKQTILTRVKLLEIIEKAEEQEV